jgi:hypothetical protein
MFSVTMSYVKTANLFSLQKLRCGLIDRTLLFVYSKPWFIELKK